MEVKSIKKSYIYNLILTSINMIFPLITAPYLSYTLGAENIGKVNYATSIVNWFILFASFGIPRYGIREIARNRDNKENLSNSFWNLLIIQTILSIISIIVYLVIILNLQAFQSEINLYLIMIVLIVLNIFSIDWFYQGIEQYGYITIRNAIVKVLSILLIFLMIKRTEHYIIYALISILGLSFNNILNYLNTKKYIEKRITKFKLIYYIKELRIYFMTTLVIALYTRLDQTFIGALSQEDLAYYIRSKTVQSIGINIVDSLITVFVPRTAYLVKNNYKEYVNIVNKSINYIYILAFPCVAGLFLLSTEIMIIFGGREFIPASYSLKIISIIVLISSIGTWQVNQILIPNKQEKIALNIQILAAVVSIVSNIILIPRYSYIGAAITAVLTESILVVVEGFIIKNICKKINIKYISSSFIKYIIATVFMCIWIIFIKNILKNNISILIISLTTSPIIYFGIIIVQKEKILIDIITEIKNKYFIKNKIN